MEDTFAGIEMYRRRKVYKVFDEILDAVLDRETVEVSDLQKTELSALANILLCTTVVLFSARLVLKKQIVEQIHE